MAMFWRILCTLMWRHYLSRKARYVCFVLELGLPMFFFYSIYSTRNELFHVDSAVAFKKERDVVKSEPISLMSILEPALVLYTPETNFTRILMSLVAKKLGLKLLDTIPDRSESKVHGYFPFTFGFTIFDYSKSMGLDEAVVEFHNISEFGSLPDSLTYTIRMKTPLDVYEYLRKKSAFVLPKLYGAVYESFLTLQWAIETSFIQLLTGKEVKQKVTLQEFSQADNKPALNELQLASIKAILTFLMTNFSMIIIFYMFTSRLLNERTSGVQELMETMGVSSCALILSHVLNACLSGLAFAGLGTFWLKLGPDPLLEKCDVFLLFITFFLHFFSFISAGAALSYLGSKAPNIAVTVLMAYVALTVPSYFLLGAGLKGTILLLTGIIFNVPLMWCTIEAFVLELSTGLNHESMMSSHSGGVTGSVFAALIFLIIQTVICFSLCCYFQRVCASVYGTALPWNFCCQKAYWRKTVVDTNVETQTTQVQDQKYFETQSGNIEAGIRVINVTKDYPSNPGALDNLTLDINKGEITILLGHNGAGKSTLISIITGMTSATKGKVLVNGLDVMSQKAEARKYIGLCPQQNMFLSDLTVIQHVMFFTLIKKGTIKEARKSAEALLDKLLIRDKQNAAVSSLSGGMKRRVQLACALAGDASVLLLDEPTSGLDVETRRSLWDLLLSFRGSHTVLLSTHFMEEADALGDRVAALSTGQLRCHATPMHLKRAMGLGYRLTLTTTNKPDEEAITKTVQSVIAGAEVRDITLNSISYQLPIEKTKNFSTLFAKLEANKSELGIESMAVGVSTLEEVFLKLCSGDHDPLTEDFTSHKAPKYKKLTGKSLRCRQISALLKRYFIFLWRFKFTQIFFAIIGVMLLIILATFSTNDKKENKKSLPSIDLDMSSPDPNSTVLFRWDGIVPNLRRFSNQYPGIQFEDVSDISEAVFRTGQGIMNPRKYVAAIDINDTHAKVFYINSVHHGAAATLNLLSNLMAARAKPRAKGRTITVLNSPLPGAYTPYSSPSFITPKSQENCDVWSFMIVFFMLLGSSCFVMMPSKEYSTGARLNHLLAGCLPEIHWAVTIITTTLQVLVTYCLALVISCTAADSDNTFSDANFIFAVSFVVILATIAILVFTCEVTFHYSPNVTMGISASMLLLSLIILPIVLDILKYQLIRVMFTLIVPHYTFYLAIRNCVAAATLNALCKLNRDKCPLTDVMSSRFSNGKCCGSQSNPVCYFCSDTIGKDLIILTCQIILYTICLVLRQRGLCSLVWEKVMNRSYKPPEHRYNDEAIKKEQKYVEKTIKQPTKQIPDIVLVSDVHKNYKKLFFCDSFNAVKGVSFSVKKGECFGLLGVNGAGKSSMFQILSVNHSATRGRILANNNFLKIPCIDEYIKSLSYCPQFWGLNDFLTGRENLSLVLTLGGLNTRDANAEAMAWIKLINMERYADRVVSEYSGGCLRRMAAVTALCTGAPLTMMDEPTAGVDVSARRYVWSAIRRALKEKRAIIITSHSLDEMEILCQRIAIMARGEVCVLGSPSRLRSSFAMGHSVIFKLIHLPETDKDAKNKVDQLKKTIENTFNCTLKDEHKTMLHYHIKETMQYNQLFEGMELIQSSSSGLVEDYSVSETTLEEVFISLAKAQDENPEEKGKKTVKMKP